MKKVESDDAGSPLLICGEYTALQRTRAEVLRLAGFSVETASSTQEAEDRLRQNQYRLLLLCQSLGEARIEQLNSVAAAAGVSTYEVEALTTPEDLISDVTARARDKPQQA